MQVLRAIFSSSSSPAHQWRAPLYVALSFARQISALARTHPRRALAKANMLEAWCICAMTEVSLQITANGRAAEARKPFREQLAPIAIILNALLHFAQRMKASLKAAIAKRLPAPLVLLPAPFPETPARKLAFIDTS